MEAMFSNVLEINPQEIFENMKKDFYDNYSITNILNISKDYIKIRKDLINLIYKVSKKMGFKSQAFFLSVYYLDIILIENKKIDLNKLNILSLSCLIVASKYCENDPNVPPLENFIDLYNKYNNKFVEIKIDDLFEMEVYVLKYLDYNVYYMTIYDFNLFFFNHGIIKKQQIKDIINNNVNIKNNNKNNKSDISSNEDDDDFILDSNYIKKILEKIYKRSRYYLDLIICNEHICLKFNALLISIYTMKKSVEEIILHEYKLKNKDYYLNKRQIIKKTNFYFKEVMNNFYKLDYELFPKYNELINDKDIINIFPQQEKIHDIKNKKISKSNLLNFKKVLPLCQKKENYIIKKNNNSITINGISNLTTSATIEENQSPNIILNSFTMKNKDVILSGNNSLEKNRIKNSKINNAFYEYYNHANRAFYNKTLGNIKKNRNNLMSSNININATKIDMNNNNNSNSKNSNSYIEKVDKKKHNCTFTQLKNNLKKNFSLNKKRCKDRYSHINNLKSLCKLTSCSNTIKNIKEGSFVKSNINHDETHCGYNGSSLEKIIIEENEKLKAFINSYDSNNNFLSNKSLRKIKNLKNMKNYYSKEKSKNNNNVNIYFKEDDLFFENLNKSLDDEKEQKLKNNKTNNKYNKIYNKIYSHLSNNIIIDNKSNKSNKSSKSKGEKDNIKNYIKYANANVINEVYNTNICNSNRNKPYFRKVIHNYHNYDLMKKKIINKNKSIKANIDHNGTNIENNNTSNKNLDYISLSNNTNANNLLHEDNRIELIKKRIISINNRNNLDKLISNNNNKSNNNLEISMLKNLYSNKGKSALTLDKDKDNDTESDILSSNYNFNIINNNNSQNKIINNIKNIYSRIYSNYSKNKKSKNKNKEENPPQEDGKGGENIKEASQSPILFQKEIKSFNINYDRMKNKKELVSKNPLTSVENKSSYHKKNVVNSLNKKKNKILNKFKKNKTINIVRNSNGFDCINMIKNDENLFINKYKKNQNLISKRIIKKPLNNFNTIDSTNKNGEVEDINKTIENEHITKPIKSNELKIHQKTFSIISNNNHKN